ncbi:MAG TPA: GreA/GreB family elongation factor [Candidatus Saccharimonadales bacterium]|nr:GreA/GreB family elongation factor [Candidatus Saccharimonadales bacterium]
MATDKRAARQRYYLSPDGTQRLRSQLAGLQSEYAELRSKLTELRQIKDADDFDMVEDTMRLEFLEKETARVAHILANSEELRANPTETSTVQLGTRVRLEQDGKHLECMVVSAFEADPSEGKISDQSPLGRALLGKMINALVEVVAPRARVMYKIIGIGPAGR